MKIQTILLCCFCLLCTASWGQVPSLEKKASVEYKDVRLEDALIDLKKKFGLKFCYSSNYIPIDKKISISLVAQPLRLILDALFLNTDVVYFIEGDQFILQKSKKKKSKLTEKIAPPPLDEINQEASIDIVPKATLVRTKTTAPKTKTKTVPTLQENAYEAVEQPKRKKRANVLGTIAKIPDVKITPEGNQKVYARLSLPAVETPEKVVLGQVSVLPFLSTNYKNTAEITNKVSYNIFWGHNGGVDGFEAGGFVNSIKYDVKGVQLAGFGNMVGGDVEGTQLSGLFNYTKGNAKGAQGAGLVNLANNSEALQVAGLGNVTEGNFSGVQVSGLGNIAKDNTEGTQVAGLFNISKSGTAKTQFSSLFNIAEDVSRGQMSVFFNKAKKVEGFQFALINICDTITGPSIGLFNLVKKGGYNRFEIGLAPDLHLMGSYKFGSPYLYSIVQLGTNWNKNGTAWSIGYGVGRVIPFKEDRHFNAEVVVSKINENEAWTKELNLLTQIRATYDIQSKGRLSFFFGPSLNISISKSIQEFVPLTFGSNIAPYNILNITSGDTLVGPEGTIDQRATNVKIWLGLSTGIRF